jgi:ADP-ribosylglycohydrolase
MAEIPQRIDRLRGTLLGTALGDALGLPMEGLSSKQIEKRFGPAIGRYHLCGRTGFVSDDTEQSALVAQALVRGGEAPGEIERAFRRSLAGWFLRLPFGIGFSTLRACLLLCLGFRRTGIRSAGNGCAMRSAIVGSHWSSDADKRIEIGRRLARVTHTDSRAIEAALFIAELAARCARSGPDTSRQELVEESGHVLRSPELRSAIALAAELDAQGSATPAAAKRLGNTGFAVHTLGLVTFCFQRHGGQPLPAVQQAIAAGGDTDTIAAIVGALVGALHGESGLPGELIAAIHDGPFGPSHLRALADELAGPVSERRAPRWSALAALLRNLALYPVVLAHGLRRLWPF